METVKEAAEKYSFADAFKLLASNKYYVIICIICIMTQILTAALNMGIPCIQGDATLLGTFSLAINIPLINGLLFTPFLVKRSGGMYKLNLFGYALAAFARGGVILGGYMGNLPVMLICSGIASIGIALCKVT